MFLEPEYGYILAISFDVHDMLRFVSENEDSPLDLLLFNKLFDEFMDQYARVRLEDP